MNLKRIIKEELTGLEWLEGINPYEMTFRVGDVIQVRNVGDGKSFFNWLGDYGNVYLNGEYGKFITGTIYNLDSTRIKIEELNTGDHITFPTYSDMKNLDSVYKNLNLLYELLNTEY